MRIFGKSPSTKNYVVELTPIELQMVKDYFKGGGSKKPKELYHDTDLHRPKDLETSRSSYHTQIPDQNELGTPWGCLNELSKGRRENDCREEYVSRDCEGNVLNTTDDILDAFNKCKISKPLMISFMKQCTVE